MKEIEPVKLCRDCVHFVHHAYCDGPHVAPDVVYGKGMMTLPRARTTLGYGLRENVEPCGTEEARYWQKRPDAPPSKWVNMKRGVRRWLEASLKRWKKTSS